MEPSPIPRMIKQSQWIMLDFGTHTVNSKVLQDSGIVGDITVQYKWIVKPKRLSIKRLDLPLNTLVEKEEKLREGYV